MTTYYLYYNSDSIIDLKDYYACYNYEGKISGKHEPRLKHDAPMIINVEGSYIKYSDIRNLIYKSYPNHKSYNEYCWMRDNNGRPIRYREPNTN